MEVRAIRMIGRVPMWTMFGLYIPMSEEQVEGVVERVWAWGEGWVEVRRKSRGWGKRGFSVGDAE